MNFPEPGMPFTPVDLCDNLWAWKTQNILSLGLITPELFKRLTSGSVPMRHAANMSGACAGRTDSYALTAGGAASRGRRREDCCTAVAARDRRR